MDENMHSPADSERLPQPDAVTPD